VGENSETLSNSQVVVEKPLGEEITAFDGRLARNQVDAGPVAASAVEFAPVYESSCQSGTVPFRSRRRGVIATAVITWGVISAWVVSAMVVAWGIVSTGVVSAMVIPWCVISTMTTN
jgi:hypothetical protein